MDETLNQGNIKITREKRWFGFQLLVIFLVLTLGIRATGYPYYKNQEQQLFAVTKDQLNAVADLKVKQIVAWRNERILDTNLISKNQIILSFIHHYLDHPADSDLNEKISSWMKVFRENNNYKTIILADAQGNERFCVPQEEKGSQKYFYCLEKLREKLFFL